MTGRKTKTVGLTGKNVLITGAARHIGREIALSMAAAGANVAITYLQSRSEAEALVRQIKNLDAKGFALRCDVRDERSVLKAAAQMVGELGGLDVLVNNAALYETVELDRLTVAQWDEMFNTNVR